MIAKSHPAPKCTGVVTLAEVSKDVQSDWRGRMSVTLASKIGAGRISRNGVLAVCLLVASRVAVAQTESISVDLKLRSGGALSGWVVESTSHGLVVARQGVPYVFAWKELESGSAYQARRALLDLKRGGRGNYSAEDYFQLGLFALSQERPNLASNDFAASTKLDASFEARVRRAYDEYRRKKRADATAHVIEPGDREPRDDARPTAAPGLLERIRDEVPKVGDGAVVTPLPPEVAAHVESIYRSFGATVQQKISKNILLVETEHFLIWTDWPKRFHSLLSDECESMYRALCGLWGLNSNSNVFLAKCPVFCFRAKPRFREFARLFDGHDAKNSIGYTRSIEASGHVHVVLLRQGDEPSDFDRFASTLVHEGTHAFVHRLGTTRLIPHWVNEGYADLMAERVLGERCFTGENSALLARQYAKYGWPIGRFLESVGPIEVHEYPLAHSVVEYLDQTDARALLGFIQALKGGHSIPQALADNYTGMTLTDLESRWREWIAGRQPFTSGEPDRDDETPSVAPSP